MPKKAKHELTRALQRVKSAGSKSHQRS